MTKLSVIIPTHRRSKILKQCLHHLEKQTIANEMEVIVVSDGPDDETRHMIESNNWNINVRYFDIPKSHQGVARNKGVDEAKSDLCLFIGDDIFCDPKCCELHVETHIEQTNKRINEQQCAVLGFTTWDPKIEITPVMKWLETSGWQFGYPMIKKYSHDVLPADIQHRFTYTSNISLPTPIARNHRFLANVQLYGWEDMEWGKRKRDAGIRLFYEPDAKAFHHHAITLDDSLQRMRIIGQSLKHIEERIPDFDMRPSGIKYYAQKIQTMLPTMAGKHRKAFFEGLESA